MFKLKLPTDPRWVNIVEKNIEEILTDHAFCEQKAASNAYKLNEIEDYIRKFKYDERETIPIQELKEHMYNILKDE
jgi:tRNA isopentenyl-2-thiomethyl-A-37 hydroxylase MiaE